MSIRSISAAAGLVLALTLSVVGATGKGAEAGAVVAASAGDTPTMTAALNTAPVSASHRFTPSPYADEARQIWVPMPKAPEPAPRPVPAPKPVAEPAPPPAAPGSIDEVINRHFGASAGRAKAIAQCESRMNPNAVSPTNDHGLFQINIVHRGQFESVTGAPWSSVYDAELNTVYAKWLYNQQGWGPWVCNRKV